MDKFDFESMTRDELAHFMVDRRGTPEGVEARQAYIRRLAEKAKLHGIDIYNPPFSTKFGDS